MEGKTIVIIDDDRDYGNALQIVLENQGYKVRHALNVREGREAIEKVRPDLVILDVMMDRHTDGFDLCAALKNDEILRGIPVLMVTAVTEKTGFKFSPWTDGEYCPADDYVAKPIPVSDLLLRVERLLSRTT